jgi:hypothetical protein
MRSRKLGLVVLGLTLLGGCQTWTAAPFWSTPLGVVLLGNVAVVPVVHRTAIDAIVSVALQHDCSAVRLEQGLSYCKPYDAPPAPLPYCTRSLANVDCWQDPAALPHPAPPEVADGPRTLTPAQERDRTQWLPFM